MWVSRRLKNMEIRTMIRMNKSQKSEDEERSDPE
jgi:hypothetical protein